MSLDVQRVTCLGVQQHVVHTVTSSPQDKQKYEVVIGQWKTSDELVGLYSSWLTGYPGLLGLIDPLHPKVHACTCTCTLIRLFIATIHNYSVVVFPCTVIGELINVI